MLESPPSPLYLLGNIEKGKRQKKIFVPVHFSKEPAKQEETTGRGDRKRNSRVGA